MITFEEEKWAQDIFSKEIDEYDVTFITTDEFLDYLNTSPEAKKDLSQKNNQFDCFTAHTCENGVVVGGGVFKNVSFGCGNNNNNYSILSI